MLAGLGGLGWLVLGAMTVVAAPVPGPAPAATDGNEWRIPARPDGAETGSAFARRIAGMELSDREAAIEAEILRGNVPTFVRRWRPVRLVLDGRELIVRVLADYLAVGSDDDWIWVPMGPATAGRIAERTGCLLPTRRVVDAVHRAADVRLAPQPMTPGPEMTTVAAFARHTALVRTQWVAAVETWRRTQVGTAPVPLVAGHKKDVVQAAGLARLDGRVAIYGWHRTNGVPIQPLYLGHAATWIDYSHGVRLVWGQADVGGQVRAVAELLRDPAWGPVLRDDGAGADGAAAGGRAGEPAQTSSRVLPEAGAGERFRWVDAGPQVRALMSEPVGAGDRAKEETDRRPVRLIFYALPNGNTIEETVGRSPRGSNEWRFGIQHIGAQTRYLRERDPSWRWLVIYLEAEGLAWPAWRRRHTNHAERIVGMVTGLVARHVPAGVERRVVLSGHSGGGSWIVGYLNGVRDVGADIERLAFLDANYAYDPALGHAEKLARWLEGGTNRFLTVLAYDDASALLDGKPFVSASGGTWGRSRRMLEDLGARWAFERRTWEDGFFGRGDDPPGVADASRGVAAGALLEHRALGGRVQLWLRENPERRILHTVQVERNGLIHVILAGTSGEGRGYRYLGPRVYDRWVLPAP